MPSLSASGERAVEIHSTDGTKLAARVRGAGSPLVLVHGTAIERSDWLGLPELLARGHEVWTYDRRGRGESTDGSDYALEREVDDVQAVLAAVGEPAHLLGHSFGAVCAMEASLRGIPLQSLILYEPPVHVDRVPSGVRRATARFEAGDPEGAVAAFLVEVAGMSTAEFESFRTDTRQHNATVGRAATITREIQALAALSWEPTRFAAVTVPTLHIAGELTVGPAYPTHQDISAAFPDASHVTIPGQAHVAFAYDPDGFADIVLEFTAGVRLSG